MTFQGLLILLSLPSVVLGAQCLKELDPLDDAEWMCGLQQETRLSQSVAGTGYTAVNYDDLWTGNRCGYCGGPSNDTLTRLVDTLRAKQRECRKLVVVSAAFGKKYLWRFAYPHDRAEEYREQFGRCFLRFVDVEELEELANHRKHTIEVDAIGEHAARINAITEERRASGAYVHPWPDNLNTLVPINMTGLPFAAPRRNGKIFKLIAHRLFPWAERILWIDSKLKVSEKMTPMEYFDATIHETNACAAFMGLPDGAGDIRGQEKAIEGAAQKRPVTDSIEVVIQQVYKYQQEDGKFAGRNLMIDGALIAWYFGSDRCRHFSSLLGCAWFNEVQCFSDRDQVSFSYTLLRALGIKQEDTVSLYKKRPPTVEDLNGDPIVVIIPSFRKASQKGHLFNGLAHWYYGTRAAIFGTSPSEVMD